MIRRIISVALIVLGLAAVLAAVGSATIWRPTDTATLSLPARPDTPVVVTEPGVLEVLGDEVDVRATAAPDENVTVAVGRTEDVDAWIGEVPQTRVTGLNSWQELSVTTVETAPAPDEDGTEEDDAAADSLPRLGGSDLWILEERSAEPGEAVEFTWTERDGRWSLLAVSSGEDAPELSLTWDVEVSTPYLWPGVAAGSALILLGLLLLLLSLRSARRARRRAEARQARQEAVAARADETAVLTAIRVDDEPGERPEPPARTGSPATAPAEPAEPGPEPATGEPAPVAPGPTRRERRLQEQQERRRRRGKRDKPARETTDDRPGHEDRVAEPARDASAGQAAADHAREEHEEPFEDDTPAWPPLRSATPSGAASSGWRSTWGLGAERGESPAEGEEQR